MTTNQTKYQPTHDDAEPVATGLNPMKAKDSGDMNSKQKCAQGMVWSELNVGQLKRVIEKLNIPNDAKIRVATGKRPSPPGPVWTPIGGISFYRNGNEVSIW